MSLTSAQRRAFIIAAKRLAIPVASCVRADLRFDHLTSNQSRDGLLALITVLAECADPVKLKAVTKAPGDEGMPPVDREDVLRAAEAEYKRLIRAKLPVPSRVRVLKAEYCRNNRQRRRDEIAAAEAESRAA